MKNHLAEFFNKYPQFLNCGHFAVAVSGGGDSMALAFTIHEYFKSLNNPPKLTAFHFDHGLRKESSNEAIWVKEQLEKIGVSTVIGTPENKIDEGNIQQAARLARYSFFAKEAEKQNINAVFVAHTQGDVAETFLMRAARGSGIAGLAAIKEVGEMFGLVVLRPFLNAERKELRDYLTENKIKWIDDPSNENKKFMRIKVRKLFDVLNESGIEVEHLAAASTSLRRADDALEFFTNNAWERFVTNKNNVLEIANEAWLQPEEIALRIIAKAILTVKPALMAPRTSKRQKLLSNINNGELPKTLGGCKFIAKNSVVEVRAEKLAK